MALATAPRDQCVKQFFDIDTVGLHSTGATIHLQAGRIHDPTVNAPQLEEARQPEAVVARLVAERQLRHRCPAASSLAIKPSASPPLIGCRLGLSRSGNWIAQSQLFLLSSRAA